MFALSLHRERGAMVVDDLRAFPSAPMVIAEGTPCHRPWSSSTGSSARAGGVAAPHRRVPAARLARARGSARASPASTRLLAGEIARDAHACGVTVLDVDGSRDVDGMVVDVTAVLGDALAVGSVRPLAGGTSSHCCATRTTRSLSRCAVSTPGRGPAATPTPSPSRSCASAARPPVPPPSSDRRCRRRGAPVRTGPRTPAPGTPY